MYVFLISYISPYLRLKNVMQNLRNPKSSCPKDGPKISFAQILDKENNMGTPIIDIPECSLGSKYAHRKRSGNHQCYFCSMIQNQTALKRAEVATI